MALGVKLFELQSLERENFIGVQGCTS
jgi:hypothetical protein